MFRFSRPLLRAAIALILACSGAANAQAQSDPAAPSTSMSTSGVQTAAPDAIPATSIGTPALSPICTDRPTKSNYACTVDPGHFQYESDIANGSFLRANGVATDTYLIVNPTLKYGLTSNLDVEANIAPTEIVYTHDNVGDDRTIVGLSDMYLRLKYEFLNVEGGTLQAAILPYIKVPTARSGIGNGVVEAGAILPVNYKLTGSLTLTIDPELDFYKDSTGDRRHLNTAQLINLGISLPHNFTVYGELWGDWNFDPAGTVKQYSADTAVAYGVSNYLQLDAGLNFGLNRYTPSIQGYVGVSQKFF